MFATKGGRFETSAALASVSTVDVMAIGLRTVLKAVVRCLTRTGVTIAKKKVTWPVIVHRTRRDRLPIAMNESGTVVLSAGDASMTANEKETAIGIVTATATATHPEDVTTANASADIPRAIGTSFEHGICNERSTYFENGQRLELRCP